MKNGAALCRMRNLAAAEIVRDLSIYTAEGAGTVPVTIICRGLGGGGGKAFKTVRSVPGVGFEMTGLRFPGVFNGEETVSFDTRRSFRRGANGTIVLAVYRLPNRPARVGLLLCRWDQDGLFFETDKGERVDGKSPVLLGRVYSVRWYERTLTDVSALVFRPDRKHTRADRNGSYLYWLSFQRFGLRHTEGS